MGRLQLNIKNSQGIELYTRIELPADQKPEHFAIFAHCFTCSSNLNAVRHISRSLTQHGFGVVQFDFTGLGKSEGAFADSHFGANVRDIMDVHQYIAENYKAPELLIGHSLGGAAVLVAASKIPEIKAVSTIGAPASVGHVAHLFDFQGKEIKKDELQQVSIGGRPFSVNQQFIEELHKTDLLNTVASLKKPYLIFHSPFDKIVGVENAKQLYHHAYHPKSFISLDQADHLLSDSEDARYVGDMIGAWAQRYTPKKREQKLSTEGHQLVAHIDMNDEGYTTRLLARQHHFLADEPESVGGNDFAPTPSEYLLGALSACTVITLKMYAKRKKWDLEEVYVQANLEKRKRTVQEGENKIIGPSNANSIITKKIDLIGNLDEEQRKRLLQISAKCPIHKILSEGADIHSSLVE